MASRVAAVVACVAAATALASVAVVVRSARHEARRLAEALPGDQLFFTTTAGAIVRSNPFKTHVMYTCLEEDLGDIVASDEAAFVVTSAGDQIWSLPVPDTCVDWVGECDEIQSFEDAGGEGVIEGDATWAVYRMAYDDENEEIYFTDSESGGIWRVAAGGGEAQEVVAAANVGGIPRGIAVSASADLLVWSAEDADPNDGEDGENRILDAIWSSALDGSGPTRRFAYVSPGNDGWTVDSISLVKGAGGALDLLWVEHRPTEEAIQKSSALGEEVWLSNKIHTGIPRNSDAYVAASGEHDTVFWSTALASHIQVAALDGSFEGYTSMPIPEETHARGLYYHNGLPDLPSCSLDFFLPLIDQDVGGSRSGSSSDASVAAVAAATVAVAFAAAVGTALQATA